MRREACEAHRRRAVFGRRDSWDHDARGSKVQSLADLLRSAQRHAHEGRRLRRLRGADQMWQALRAVRPMLEVEDDEVPARPAEYLDDLRAWRLHPGAVQHLFRGERLPQTLRVHEPGVLLRRILIVPATQTFSCWLQI